MNIAIIGSRSFHNYELVKSTVNDYVHQNTIKIHCIVSGGAKGADTLAQKFALEYQLDMIVYKPDWKRFGKRAGFIRNTEIIENSDVVIAFWDGSSNGTKDSITKAKQKNKIVIVIIVSDQGLSTKLQYYDYQIDENTN